MKKWKHYWNILPSRPPGLGLKRKKSRLRDISQMRTLIFEFDQAKDMQLQLGKASRSPVTGSTGLLGIHLTWVKKKGE